MKTYMVRSSKSETAYQVVQDGAVWSCDCPHFVYRLSGTGVHCKHIKEVQSMDGPDVPDQLTPPETIALLAAAADDYERLVESVALAQDLLMISNEELSQSRRLVLNLRNLSKEIRNFIGAD